MTAYLLSFDSGANLEVRSFDAREQASALFEVDIEATSPDPDLDMESIAGRPASLTILTGLSFALSPGRTWSGVCARIRQVRSEPAGLSTYRLTIVPRLWLLTLRTDNRLFQHLSIPDIVLRLLEPWGIAPEFRLDRAAYPRLELRTQYEETDHAFFSRLLEEAGITCLFESDLERGTRLVLTDAPGRAPERPGPPLPFVDQVSQAQAAEIEHVTAVHLFEEARPGLVTLRDQDPRRPRHALSGASPEAPPPEHLHEHYHHTPGAALVEAAPGAIAEAARIGPAMESALAAAGTPVADNLGTARHDDAALEALAARRLEALRTGRRSLSFSTNAADVGPGSIVRIAGHPRMDIGPDRAWLVTERRFTGTVGGEHTTRVRSVLAAEPYRPAAVTPRPRVFGRHTATVVGPAKDLANPFAAPSDSEIHCDEFGRVRVQFPWDRLGEHDDRSSAWMRVSAGWAGTGYGLFALPRVGHEVLVAFIDGDPDQPYVAGRLHNGAAPVPYALPSHKTLSTWKSDSSPHDGGYNEIKLEDRKGSELFHVHAQRDFASLVKHDEMTLIGRDRMTLTGRDEISATGNDRTRGVHRDERATVGRDRTEQVKRDASESVGRNRSSFVRGDEVDAVAGDRHAEVGLDRHAFVGREDSHIAGARFSVLMAQGGWARAARTLTGLRQTPILAALTGPVAPVLSGLLATAWDGPLGALASEWASSPLAASAFASLSESGSLGQALSALPAQLKSLLSLPDQIRSTPSVGLPTRLEMVDHEITLTTGEATVLLNGPDIALIAAGEIRLHAARRLSVVSAADTLVAQSPDLQFNPPEPDSPPPRVADEIRPPPPGSPPVAAASPGQSPAEPGSPPETPQPVSYAAELPSGASVVIPSGGVPLLSELPADLLRGASTLPLAGAGLLVSGLSGSSALTLLASQRLPAAASAVGHADALLEAFAARPDDLPSLRARFGRVPPDERDTVLNTILSLSPTLYLLLVPLPLPAPPPAPPLFDPARLARPDLDDRLAAPDRSIAERAMLVWESFLRDAGGLIPMQLRTSASLRELLRNDASGVRPLGPRIGDVSAAVRRREPLLRLFENNLLRAARHAVLERGSDPALRGTLDRVRKVASLLTEAGDALRNGGEAIWRLGNRTESVASLLRILPIETSNDPWVAIAEARIAEAEKRSR
ncbi:MAG: type VI secretion system tip protein TssI/VgrG [Polyangiaceae bacterium]